MTRILSRVALRHCVLAVSIVVLASCGTSAPLSSPTKTPVLFHYATVNPGPNCDTKGGIWQLVGYATFTCHPDSLEMSGTEGPKVQFNGSAAMKHFPVNYEVRVDITSDGLFYVGVEVRDQSGQYSGYLMTISSFGDWEIYGLNPNDKRFRGQYPLKKPDHLDIRVQGNHYTMTVNNSQLASFDDMSYPSGNSVGLYINSGTSRRLGTAFFSNFSIQELAP